MELILDLDEAIVKLAKPQEFARFQVTVAVPDGASPATHDHRLGDVVSARNIGVVSDDGDVYVDPAILRFLSAGEVDEDWEHGFASMLAVADTSGWLDHQGRIQAHVVWPKA
jgi:hypothetical protein